MAAIGSDERPANSPDVASIDGFQDYAAFACQLESEIEGYVFDRVRPDSRVAKELLDGAASTALEKLVALDVRRKLGAFPTSTHLARKLVRLCPSVAQPTQFWDPACGLGDLLLAASDFLSVRKTLSATMANWGNALAGSDLSEPMVRVARARIVLAAVLRVDVIDEIEFSSVLPMVRVADGMHPNNRAPGHVMVNPPFGSTLHEVDWATGSMSTAAVFVERIMEAAPEGTHISAILPDVLRSGSRYGRWRQAISRRASLDRLTVAGRFAASVDVDVIQAHFTLGKHRSFARWSRVPATRSLMDQFSVKVGTIVPHRDPLGPTARPFVRASAIRGESRTDASKLERTLIQGKGFTPPFIVLRRTSSPSDKVRARATLVTGTEPILVENHLLVLTPRDGRIATCAKASLYLGSDQVTQWLNQRIRCRHLTVSAVSGIPMDADKGG